MRHSETPVVEVTVYWRGVVHGYHTPQPWAIAHRGPGLQVATSWCRSHFLRESPLWSL